MNQAPAFSIIIPTHNRISALAACLEGIAALGGVTFQVIVVNDGGEAIPARLARACAARFPLTILNQPHRGAGAARNLGAKHAPHSWLAFLDDDCVPAHDWLVQLQRAAEKNPHAVLGGDTRNGLPHNLYAEASQSLLAFLYDYYHASYAERAQLPYFASNNFALARRAFQAIGGFDEDMAFAEDRDLGARLAAAGHPFVRVPEACVYHYRAMDLKSFWLQHYSYGAGAHQYHRHRARGATMTVRPEPLYFYTALLRFPWQQRHARAARLACLVALAQLANACGFFHQASRARWRGDSSLARNSL